MEGWAAQKRLTSKFPFRLVLKKEEIKVFQLQKQKSSSAEVLFDQVNKDKRVVGAQTPPSPLLILLPNLNCKCFWLIGRRRRQQQTNLIKFLKDLVYLIIVYF